MKKQPPEAPDPELVATPEEVVSAWHALLPEEKMKLDVFAAMHARWRQRYEPGMSGSELLHEAFRRTLDPESDRKWKRNQISFLEHMFGTIKSIAGDLKRTNEGRVRAAAHSSVEVLVGERDGQDAVNALENIAGDLDTPEQFAIAHDRLLAIQREFEGDETAWLVLECLYVDNLSPAATREKLGLSVPEFNAARKRISNRVPKFFLAN